MTPLLPLERPAKPPISDEEWWNGLSGDKRAKILEANGIKRSPKFAWRDLGRVIQGKISAARSAP